MSLIDKLLANYIMNSEEIDKIVNDSLSKKDICMKLQH